VQYTEYHNAECRGIKMCHSFEKIRCYWYINFFCPKAVPGWDIGPLGMDRRNSEPDQSGDNVVRLVTAVIYKWTKAWAFFPGKPFQPNLMFLSETTTYLSEALFRRSTLGKARGLTYKHYTEVERLVRDKPSNL